MYVCVCGGSRVKRSQVWRSRWFTAATPSRCKPRLLCLQTDAQCRWSWRHRVARCWMLLDTFIVLFGPSSWDTDAFIKCWLSSQRAVGSVRASFLFQPGYSSCTSRTLRGRGASRGGAAHVTHTDSHVDLRADVLTQVGPSHLHPAGLTAHLWFPGCEHVHDQKRPFFTACSCRGEECVGASKWACMWRWSGGGVMCVCLKGGHI